jgi:hypothetical protein
MAPTLWIRRRSTKSILSSEAIKAFTTLPNALKGAFKVLVNESRHALIRASSPHTSPPSPLLRSRWTRRPSTWRTVQLLIQAPPHFPLICARRFVDHLFDISSCATSTSGSGTQQRNLLSLSLSNPQGAVANSWALSWDRRLDSGRFEWFLVIGDIDVGGRLIRQWHAGSAG